MARMTMPSEPRSGCGRTLVAGLLAIGVFSCAFLLLFIIFLFVAVVSSELEDDAMVVDDATASGVTGSEDLTMCTRFARLLDPEHRGRDLGEVAYAGVRDTRNGWPNSGAEKGARATSVAEPAAA